MIVFIEPDDEETSPTSAGQIYSPAPSSRLSGATATVQWRPGASGASGYPLYQLWIGTTVGAHDVWNGVALPLGTLSAAVTGLPQTGVTLYVRLRTQVGVSDWLESDCTYLAAAGLAAMLTPANGATLALTSQAFTWSAGAGASAYRLTAASVVNPASSSDYYFDSGNVGAALGVTASGLPDDASTIYVRLWSKIGTEWFSVLYSYTACLAGPAYLTVPFNGQKLPGSLVNFYWTLRSTATQFQLLVGNAPGVGDIVSESYTDGTFIVGEFTRDPLLANSFWANPGHSLPTDGRTLYITLNTYVGGAWLSDAIVCSAYGAPENPPDASMHQIATPEEGAMLAASTTFTFTTGTSTSWRFVLTDNTGTTLHDSGAQTSVPIANITVGSIPTGSVVYARLYSLVSSPSGWEYIDYLYGYVTPETRLVEIDADRSAYQDPYTDPPYLSWITAPPESSSVIDGSAAAPYVVWEIGLGGAFNFNPPDLGKSFRAVAILHQAPINSDGTYLGPWTSYELTSEGAWRYPTHVLTSATVGDFWMVLSADRETLTLQKPFTVSGGSPLLYCLELCSEALVDDRGRFHRAIAVGSWKFYLIDPTP